MNDRGGCQCGQVRYRVAGPPLTVYACHCTDCQKQASSAFGLSVWVRQEDFVLEQGELRFQVFRGGSGRPKRCGFCPQCGSRIYHCGSFGSARTDGVIYSLKGGTLDAARALQPVAHIWARSAHRWLDLDSSGLLVFATEPADFADIVAAFGQRTEDRRQKTEDRGQKTEDRGQKTEDRGQKTEDGGLRTED